jgi:predicted dehydrogenase
MTGRRTGRVAQLTALVVGAGSIGRRHARNLRGLGCAHVAICDPDAERRHAAAEDASAGLHADVETALAAVAPDVVIVCTPPSSHVAVARAAVAAGAHVLIEKPLSDSMERVDALAAEASAARRVVQVGYNLRFHPGIRQLKAIVEDGDIGGVLLASAEFGQYLPDWRPWQDYRQSYTARHSLGGGIILDGSHEIDYVLWLLGAPTELACMAGRVSALEMDVEDAATILLRMAGGAQASVSLDCVRRTYTRRCTLIGEAGTASWDYTANEVVVHCAGDVLPTRIAYEFAPNDMYVAELEAFLVAVTQGGPSPVGLHDAELTLRVALAARYAAHTRSWTYVVSDAGLLGHHAVAVV